MPGQLRISDLASFYCTNCNIIINYHVAGMCNESKNKLNVLLLKKNKKLTLSGRRVEVPLLIRESGFLCIIIL